MTHWLSIPGYIISNVSQAITQQGRVCFRLCACVSSHLWLYACRWVGFICIHKLIHLGTIWVYSLKCYPSVLMLWPRWQPSEGAEGWHKHTQRDSKCGQPRGSWHCVMEERGVLHEAKLNELGDAGSPWVAKWPSAILQTQAGRAPTSSSSFKSLFYWSGFYMDSDQ